MASRCIGSATIGKQTYVGALNSVCDTLIYRNDYKIEYLSAFFAVDKLRLLTAILKPILKIIRLFVGILFYSVIAYQLYCQLGYSGTLAENRP